MHSCWSDSDAERLVETLSSTCDREMALRLYSARLLGADDSLVLHGGGNVSLKGEFVDEFGTPCPAIFVKSSGSDLDSLTSDALPALDLDGLRRFESIESMTDRQLVRSIRRYLFNPDAPTPSVETFVHAFLPFDYVDHTHADALLVLTNQPDERLLREAIGDDAVVLPYIRPGFELARAILEVRDQFPPEGGAIVLVRHGLFTFGRSAKESYERHVDIVQRCVSFIHAHRASVVPRVEADSSASNGDDALALAREMVVARLAPMIRGRIAPSDGHSLQQAPWPSVMTWESSASLLHVLSQPSLATLMQRGPLTSDHVVRVGAWPCVLNFGDALVDGELSADDDRIASVIDEALAAFDEEYQRYVDAGQSAEDVDKEALQAARAQPRPWLPRVFLVPGLGVLAWGEDKKRSRVTCDIAVHAVSCVVQAERLGKFVAVEPTKVFDAEFRPVQRTKMVGKGAGDLAGRVVLVTGGAGAIGLAIVERCLAEGACVGLADLHDEAINKGIERLGGDHDGRLMGLVMDVTDVESVRDGFRSLVSNFGGLDVLVPNAGIALASSLDDMALSSFHRVMNVNVNGYLHVMLEAYRLLVRQGIGGHVVLNSSKNVFSPGKDFGAYSASKAAGHQLGKVAAIEWAEHGIRVNMINADGVFGDDETPSGLWKEVGPGRARSRDLSLDELPEFYRKRNLLQVRVTGQHVGEAVVFFASGRTPTTGATLPVDGGVKDAFPR
ncbi:MAG: bifunctional aldolase/short-chain dehydrogenase [Phycisphaerae bacterium]